MNDVLLNSKPNLAYEWIEDSSDDHHALRTNGLGFLLDIMAIVVDEGPYTHGELVDKMLAVAPGFDRVFFDQLLWLLVGNELGTHFFRRNAEGHLHPL